jgi:hypothetical protein
LNFRVGVVEKTTIFVRKNRCNISLSSQNSREKMGYYFWPKSRFFMGFLMAYRLLEAEIWHFRVGFLRPLRELVVKKMPAYSNV